MKIKKILFVGDSNMLSRNNKLLQVNDTYVYKIKKFFRYKNFDIEQVNWGGISTSQLINFSIMYFEKWQPDFLIVHSGINDIKTQFINSSLSNKIIRMLDFFKINKKIYKENILYNKKLLKFYSINKTSVDSFLEIIKKLKSKFSKSNIFWIEIHADHRIDFERFGTFESIKKYNSILKENFSENLIKIGFNKNIYQSDGFHLNKNGHLILFKKLCKILN